MVLGHAVYVLALAQLFDDKDLLQELLHCSCIILSRSCVDQAIAMQRYVSAAPTLIRTPSCFTVNSSLGNKPEVLAICRSFSWERVICVQYVAPM